MHSIQFCVQSVFSLWCCVGVAVQPTEQETMTPACFWGSHNVWRTRGRLTSCQADRATPGNGTVVTSESLPVCLYDFPPMSRSVCFFVSICQLHKHCIVCAVLSFSFSVLRSRLMSFYWSLTHWSHQTHWSVKYSIATFYGNVFDSNFHFKIFDSKTQLVLHLRNVILDV